ncbi:hypothetical protein DOO78_02355 [Roseicella frigidaeris]|uniref:Uncharacterized protein n=1 Tax=Roseicella frigidaeris TaxID=2230885 RepID=A0A327MLF9_9PROT|nr:hypothetical protein DOO78_02355 [Roseicella frigidaeris]
MGRGSSSGPGAAAPILRLAMPDDAGLHDRDWYAWTQDQAARLRAWPEQLRPNGLDVREIAEEIESLGTSDRRANHLVPLAPRPAGALTVPGAALSAPQAPRTHRPPAAAPRCGGGARARRTTDARRRSRDASRRRHGGRARLRGPAGRSRRRRAAPPPAAPTGPPPARSRRRPAR